MDDSTFWTIIGEGSKKEEDLEARLGEIRERLADSSSKTIRAFDKMLWDKLFAAYDWRLWGAAYLINGGCSDDGFLYFRCWLVVQGREVDEEAVSNPDSLSGRITPGQPPCQFESLLGVAGWVYVDTTGSEVPTPEIDPKWWREVEPTGERWDFDDDEEMRRRLPRLRRVHGR